MLFRSTQKPSKEEGQQIISLLKGMGASYAIDEYNYPSRRAKGGHIHAQVPGAMDGGLFTGPSSGYPILLHGPGPELVLNQKQTSKLETILSQVTKKEIDVADSMPASPDNPLGRIIDMQTNLITTLSNKLDDLSDKLAKSNDIQQNILNYSI